jgi:regulator of sigma E protease
MRHGDRVVSVDGKPVRYWRDLLTTIGEAPRRRLEIVVERDGARHTLHIVPEPTVDHDRIASATRSSAARSA